jgi:hypothetical protein
MGYPAAVAENFFLARGNEGVMKTSTESLPSRTWEPMRLERAGHVADVLHGSSTTGQPDTGIPGKKGAGL